MEKLLLGILATIAGVFAIVLFGKPQGPKPTQADEPIGQVEPKLSEPKLSEPKLSEPKLSEPIFNPTSSVSELPPPMTSGRSETIANATISTPVTTLPASSPEFDPKSDADAVRAARKGDRSLETVEPLAPRAANQPNNRSTNTARLVARSMPPFAAIHDPQRPSTPELQDLSQEIITLGRSQKRSNVPLLLQYRSHENAMIRRYVAYALGQLANVGSASDRQSLIPFLQELAQDPDRDVQQMAQTIVKRLNGNVQAV